MKTSKLKWFFVIFISLLFAIILFGAIMFFLNNSFANQVKNIGKQIPIVSDWIDVDEDSEQGESIASSRLAEEADTLSRKVEEQQAEIERLQERLLEKEDEIVQYKNEIAKLEQQLSQIDDPAELTNENKMKKAKEMLESMSPKAAASIVAEMDNSDVIGLLETLDSKALGDILAKMEADRAAEITNLLLENE